MLALFMREVYGLCAQYEADDVFAVAYVWRSLSVVVDISCGVQRLTLAVYYDRHLQYRFVRHALV
jgi:hypothetical protein